MSGEGQLTVTMAPRFLEIDNPDLTVDELDGAISKAFLTSLRALFAEQTFIENVIEIISEDKFYRLIPDVDLVDISAVASLDVAIQARVVRRDLSPVKQQRAQVFVSSKEYGAGVMIKMIEKQEIDHYVEAYLDGVYDEFHISEHPSSLARFFEAGGEIGDSPFIRGYLVNLLRNYAPKPRGNSDRLRDVDVYDIIEWWLIFQPPKTPRERAFEVYCDDRPDADIDTVRKQYGRGREITNPSKKE